MTDFHGIRIDDTNPRNWLEHRMGKYYMMFRTAMSFLTVALSALCFFVALTLSYLHLNHVPRRASILVIAAGVLGALGIRGAWVVAAHSSGRRWPAVVALVLNSAVVLAVIVMYVAGAVLG